MNRRRSATDPRAPRPAPRAPRAAFAARALIVALLVVGSAIMLFPLWWMFITSLSEPGSAAAAMADSSKIQVLPQGWHWSNYSESLSKIGSRRWYGFLDALANTVVVTGFCVAGQVLSCSLVGYGFARLRFRGRDGLFVLMLSTMMLPAQVTMIPVFILFRWFGWIDTFLPLVVPMFFGGPFYTFMFRQFFAQVPEALVEAARIDGCGHLGVWWRIMLPICKPVIAITAVFTFIFAWNDFLGPLIYLQSEEQLTLAVALNAFKNQYGDFRDIHLLMAASIVTMLPCIVLFFVAQKQFVGGLTLGAVKG
ncbi:L-arabinose transport system permease protein AraQ [Phycisphaerae bacterium RAS1]|nr:L-arabinose transport system permease protein AraQ [Phycisphaerae bacterium RAS1]